MRKSFLCSLLSLFAFSTMHAQITKGNLTLHAYDNNDNIIHQEIYSYEEAKSLDINELIATYKDEARFTLKGNLFNDANLDHFLFDTRSIMEKVEGQVFCEHVEKSLKPFIGVQITSREDFNGVEVTEIVNNSPASLSGVTSGMIITHLADFEIRSICDLKIALSNFAVGDQTQITVVYEEQKILKDITIGAQIKNNITFKACTDDQLSLDLTQNELSDSFTKPEIISMKAFPNPSKGLTNVEFRSDSKSDINLIILDVNGNVLSNDKFTFSGYFSQEVKLDHYAAGLYTVLIEQDDKYHSEKVILLRD